MYDSETVKYLLEEASESLDGKPVNYSNRDGRTCLHIAALKDNLALAVYLVERHHADKSLKWRYKVRISLVKMGSKNSSKKVKETREPTIIDCN